MNKTIRRMGTYLLSRIAFLPLIGPYLNRRRVKKVLQHQTLESRSSVEAMDYLAEPLSMAEYQARKKQLEAAGMQMRRNRP